jgi:hypothetical protein
MLLAGKSNALGVKTNSLPFCSLRIAQGLQSNLGLRCEQLAAEHLRNGASISWVLDFYFNSFYVKYLKCPLHTDLLSLIRYCD